MSQYYVLHVQLFFIEQTLLGKVKNKEMFSICTFLKFDVSNTINKIFVVSCQCERQMAVVCFREKLCLCLNYTVIQ